MASMVVSEPLEILLFDLKSLVPSIFQVDETKSLLEMLRTLMDTNESSVLVFMTTSSRMIGLSGTKVAGMKDVIFTTSKEETSVVDSFISISFSLVTGSGFTSSSSISSSFSAFSSFVSFTSCTASGSSLSSVETEAASFFGGTGIYLLLRGIVTGSNSHSRIL